MISDPEKHVAHLLPKKTCFLHIFLFMLVYTNMSECPPDYPITQTCLVRVLWQMSSKQPFIADQFNHSKKFMI